MMEKQTDGKCVVCKSQIVEIIAEEHNPETGPPIIGPGSKDQYRKVSKGYHCSNKGCGLKYAFIPER